MFAGVCDSGSGPPMKQAHVGAASPSPRVWGSHVLCIGEGRGQENTYVFGNMSSFSEKQRAIRRSVVVTLVNPEMHCLCHLLRGHRPHPLPPGPGIWGGGHPSHCLPSSGRSLLLLWVREEKVPEAFILFIYFAVG